MTWLAFFLPPVIHELSHVLAGLVFRVKLYWKFRFPRLVFEMEASGTDQISRTQAVLRAGFTGEVAVMVLLIFLMPQAAGWYALGHALHFLSYPSGSLYNDFRGWC